jgi:hypothetical protein
MYRAPPFAEGESSRTYRRISRGKLKLSAGRTGGLLDAMTSVSGDQIGGWTFGPSPSTGKGAGLAAIAPACGRHHGADARQSRSA